MLTKKSAQTSKKKTTLKKKVTSLKSTKKKRPALVHASSDQCFWVTDGRILTNIVDLSNALNAMSEDVYSYHASKERNDFSEWIEHILQDSILAESLRKCQKPSTAKKVVVSRLRVYDL